MSRHETHETDFVAVGCGPFNLGLACLAEPVEDLTGVVLEQRADFAWHAGMMLEGATIQVPFLADLVTMADPTSPYSFLNFLKEKGWLYSHFIRESFYPLRSEYSEYCRWAAHRVGVRFGHRVTAVRREGERWVVETAVDAAPGPTFSARFLVLGTGTVPRFPDVAGLAQAREAGPVVHSAEYLERREELTATDAITVVGSGQSAAEIFRDLVEDAADGAHELTWLTRSPRFFPMEYTKLTLELTSPDYAAHRRGLPPAHRDALNRRELSLYKGISGELVDDIFDTLYRLRQRRHLAGLGELPVTLLSGVEVTDLTPEAGGIRLGGRALATDDRLEHRTRAIVFATGYRPDAPDFLDEVRDEIAVDEQGRYAVADDFSVDARHSLFVQNAEEHVTGLLAPDLGMGPWRSSIILRAMTGREVYPVEERIAFQEFGVPERMRPGAGS